MKLERVVLYSQEVSRSREAVISAIDLRYLSGTLKLAPLVGVISTPLTNRLSVQHIEIIIVGDFC